MIRSTIIELDWIVHCAVFYVSSNTV